MNFHNIIARVKIFLDEAASDREILRRYLFGVVLAVSCLTALWMGLGGQDSFSSAKRLWPIRWMMLGWCALHIPLYLVSRGRFYQAAYSIYSYAVIVILTVLYQTSNADPILKVTTQMTQNYTVLFVSMLLLPVWRFLAFTSMVCGVSLVWVFINNKTLYPAHGNEAATAVMLIVGAMWIISVLTAVLWEAYYRQTAKAHADISAFNTRLREDVEKQAIVIRKHQENISQMQKMEAIGLLAGGIAHDFNNKLTIVRGFGELISGKVEPGSALAGWARNILDAAGDAGLMTRQLLSFSRREMIAPRSVSLNTAVEVRREVLKRLLGEHIGLTVTLDPALGNCLFDPSQLEEVIVNLVLNARDAIGNGGQLEIRTENVLLDAVFADAHPDAKPGLHVCLTVKDSGCGMSADTMSHLFEPFFTTKPKGKGTGLGLATVYGTVKQNGGLIDVESRLGEGSSFRIYLPRVAEEISPETVWTKPELARISGKTILVVEDEARLLELIREVLSSAGYRIITAGGPREAILKSREEGGEIHLLLSDVVMADGGAGRTVAEISAQRPGITVLYMSGYADETVAAHGILDQDKNFLRKPFKPSDLLEKVGSILSKPAAG